MTKDEEIALLDKTIKKFGPNSYLGPWLAEHRGHLVADIHNDLPPDASMPSAARAEARSILASARLEADALIEEGKRQSARLLESAQRREADLRTELTRELERLLQLAKQSFARFAS